MCCMTRMCLSPTSDFEAGTARLGRYEPEKLMKQHNIVVS